MKARATMRLFLKEELFESPFIPDTPPPHGSVAGSVEAETNGNRHSPLGDTQDVQLRLHRFLFLTPQRQVMELTNALLRQFVFRLYKRREPGIISAFNSVFPRTSESLTCKLMVRALLDVMGLLDETLDAPRCPSNEEESRLSGNHTPLGDLSSSLRLWRYASVENSNTSFDGIDKDSTETVLEELVRKALRRFHDHHNGRYLRHSRIHFAHERKSSKGDAFLTSSCDGGERSGCSGNRVNRSRNSDSGVEIFTLNDTIAAALEEFFAQYTTEDEQVTVVAASLLLQHVRFPHVTFFAKSSTNGNHLGSPTDGNCSHTFESSAASDRFLKLENSACLVELLLRVQEGTSVPCCVLAALLGDSTLSNYLSAQQNSIPSMTEHAFSVLSMEFASCVSNDISSHSTSRASGSDCNREDTNNTTSSLLSHASATTPLTYEELFNRPEFPTCENDSTSPLPSLLGLYLQYGILEQMPSIETVLRRVRWSEFDQQMCSKSMSLRDSVSAAVLPSSCPLQASFPRHLLQRVPSTESTTEIAGDGIVSVKNIETMTRIGRGASGEVFVVPRLNTGELVAVKRIYLNERTRQHVDNELSVLKRSSRMGLGAFGVAAKYFNESDEETDDARDARALVRCYDTFCDGGCVFIVMELMDSGSLMDALKARSGRAFSEEECCAITFQMLHGLRYLHDTVCQLHRDLKPHNTLLDLSKGVVKLTDFGLTSSKLQSMGFNQCGTFVGTLAYMSPARVDADSVYGKESDFWSLGIMLIQLALGRLPFTPNIFTIASFRSQPPRLSNEGDDYEVSFSAAFQDFIAMLLPAQKGKGPTPNKNLNISLSEVGDMDVVHTLQQISSILFSSDKGNTEEKRVTRFSASEGVSIMGNSRAASLGHELDATTLLQHPWLLQMSWEKSEDIISRISLLPLDAGNHRFTDPEALH